MSKPDKKPKKKKSFQKLPNQHTPKHHPHMFPTPPPVPNLIDNNVHTHNSNLLSVNHKPSLPVLLPAGIRQGPEISGQLVRKDGLIFYSLVFENNMELQLGTSEMTVLPLVVFQNVSPNLLLQIVVKNNQQPVWYFIDYVSLLVLFMEDGRMERNAFLETWKSLLDSNKVSKEIVGIVINNVDGIIQQLSNWNMFFFVKCEIGNQDVLSLSAKIPKEIPLVIEITAAIGVNGIKCAIKTPNPEMAPLFFDALETILTT